MNDGNFDDENTPEPEFPFGNPGEMFQQLANLFNSTAGSWDAAKQMAQQIAGSQNEPNVNPSDRISIEDLATVAELQVANISGLTVTAADLAVENRAMFANRLIDDLQPLLSIMTTSISKILVEQADDAPQDLSLFPGGMFAALGPMLSQMVAGSFVGQVAAKALCSYELPVPRGPGARPVVLGGAVREFAEDWSLTLNDVQLWVCSYELCHHAVLSHTLWGEELTRLLSQYVGAYAMNPDALTSQVEGFDPNDLEALQSAFGSPEQLITAFISDEQRALQPRITTMVSLTIAFTDWVVDQLQARLLPTSGPSISEALRRRRVEVDESSRIVEKLLGVHLEETAITAASAFITGVIERSDVDALNQLWSDITAIPTANELAAPGLWLERREIALRDVEAEIAAFEIPDFPFLDEN